MLHYITSKQSRPERLTENKDEKYHLDFARFIVSHSNNTYHQSRISRIIVNKAFYKGNQWIFKEDLEPFLMDESGDVRNRIKFVQNYIRPKVDRDWETRLW